MKRVRTLSKFFDCDRKDVRGWDVIRNHSPPFCEQRWIEIRTLSGDMLKDCSASNDIIMHASSGILISSEIIRLNEQHPWKSVRRYVIRLWNGRARLLMSNHDGKISRKNPGFSMFTLLPFPSLPWNYANFQFRKKSFYIFVERFWKGIALPRSEILSPFANIERKQDSWNKLLHILFAEIVIE